MPGKKIAVYTADKLTCGAFWTAKTADLHKLEPAEITRQVVLETERVQVKLKDSHGNLVSYTVSVNVTREPISDAEKAEVAKFAADVETRKSKRDADETAERQRSIQTAYNYGKDGVVSALASLKDIAPAIKVMKEMGL